MVKKHLHTNSRFRRSGQVTHEIKFIFFYVFLTTHINETDCINKEGSNRWCCSAKVKRLYYIAIELTGYALKHCSISFGSAARIQLVNHIFKKHFSETGNSFSASSVE